MSLQTDIHGHMKQAMTDRDKVRVSTLRGLLSEFTNEALKLGKKPDAELTDDEVLAVIKRQAKQRKDSIDQFTAGGRPELAESEQAELAILEDFLPEQMSEDTIRTIVQTKKSELGITDKSGMGDLMKAVMAETQGQADGGTVKDVVMSELS